MIIFDNVVCHLGGMDVIKGVSFHIRRGDFTALIGANGAGKSTLGKLCNGLLKPSCGSVAVGGFNTASTKTSRIARFTGFLFQNPDRQICKNTVRDEIMFGLGCIMDDGEEAERRCETVLAAFGFKGEMDPFTMSRGERQRLVLASLLALKPELLILDEPTTGLDYRECMHIMESVRAINKQGTTVLMVSHDMEVVGDFAEDVMVLNRGQLLAKGPVKEILRDKKLLAQASLLPPQITGLALRLGDGFEEIFTVDEMVSAIEKKAKRTA
ncbi:MAG: energy-coupling factor ABC transporter ATP-binding protein [Synergistaceae bacterium]|nr:energy-coupling factor ABC transporter ATP-binding protein [Synergistaceae bacterium]